jgi:hypothetical protein
MQVQAHIILILCSVAVAKTKPISFLINLRQILYFYYSILIANITVLFLLRLLAPLEEKLSAAAIDPSRLELEPTSTLIFCFYKLLRHKIFSRLRARASLIFSFSHRAEHRADSRLQLTSQA